MRIIQKSISYITATAIAAFLTIPAFAADPGDMNMSAVPGDGVITVTWDELEYDNVTYFVFLSDVDGENYTEYKDEPEYADGKYTYIIEGLTNDKTYTVGVEASCKSFRHNIMAISDQTPYSADATVPEAPVITGLVTDNNTISVSWSAPENNGGAKIIAYEIECLPEGSIDGNGGMTIAVDAETTSYTIEELPEKNISYDVMVRAINSVGRGEFGMYAPAENSEIQTFSDVHPQNHWAAKSIDFIYTKGLMNGTDENLFSPDSPVTRAMLVTILWRMESSPNVGFLPGFEDISSDSYYAEAVNWALSENIVNGMTNTHFAPNENITREQMAAIIFRYAKYKNVAPQGTWAIQLDYTDLAEISDYAVEGIMYCKLKEIMQDKDNNAFMPKDTATRAEIAVILERLIKSAAASDAHDCEEIAVIYTNDVHCGIEDNIGYAGLAAYLKNAESEYEYVTLADCGDAIQGDFIGTVSDGEYIIDIMNELGYDFAVPGNHEFDYGMEQLSKLIGNSEAQYLACNISYSGAGENLLESVKPYEIVTYGDTKVAFIGIATPESHTKSTPLYFMEDGEYVYNFEQGDSGKKLYTCVQNYIDECEEQGADYVIALSHLGDAESSSPYTSVELIEATEGIDAVLDAHSHSVIENRYVDNMNGEAVLLSSTGTKFENIGTLVICSDGTITAKLVTDYTEKDSDCTEFIDNIKAKYSEEMNCEIATSDIALSCTTTDGIRLVRNRETAIGNFCADAYRITCGADIGVVNGGGIRADLPKGIITYADVLAIHPFGNTLCVVKATGQEIIDLLETACMYTKSDISENGNAVGENGGFMQVSGLKFTINTSVASSVVLDENSNFVTVEGKRRVEDVTVLDKNGEYVPIDTGKTYTLASHDYLLKNGGDSYTGFTDNEFVVSEGISDYQALTEYITQTLGGKLNEKYSDTEGRISIK